MTIKKVVAYLNKKYPELDIFYRPEEGGTGYIIHEGSIVTVPKDPSDPDDYDFKMAAIDYYNECSSMRDGFGLYLPISEYLDKHGFYWEWINPGMAVICEA